MNLEKIIIVKGNLVFCVASRRGQFQGFLINIYRPDNPR